MILRIGLNYQFHRSDDGDFRSWHFPAIYFDRAPRSERPVRAGPFLTLSGFWRQAATLAGVTAVLTAATTLRCYPPWLATWVTQTRSAIDLTWLSAFDDPGPGAVPPVVFLTSRATHTHFDFWKCVKYHGPGVETCGNWLTGGWAPNEDVALDAILG